MKLRNLSLKWRLVWLCVLLVTFPAVSVGYLSYRSSEKELYRSVEKKLHELTMMITNHIDTAMSIAQRKVNDDLKVAHYLLYSYGQPAVSHHESITIQATNQITKNSELTTIPLMELQGEMLAYDYTVVDQIQKLVGGTATIFQIIPEGALRISTNVLKSDGTRAVGTYIPTDSPVYRTVMRGEIFYGKAYVVNAWYQTAYEPILDSDGRP